MFDRMTDRGRKVMGWSREEAVRLGHDFIDTAHILLGIVREGNSVAFNVLKNLGVDLGSVRSEVGELAPPAREAATPGKKLLYTEGAKRALEMALEEAKGLSHNYIGTEHLLLGLIREKEGVAAQALLNLGLSLEDVRQEVLEMVSGGAAPRPKRMTPGSTATTGKQFEIEFVKDRTVIVVDLLEDKAPLSCEALWKGLAKPHRDTIHHGGETGPELWCFVPEPEEDLPYENSTVFPEHGDILFYHYIQPPTRDGVMVYDIGIYYDRGCSKLKQGWIPGNLFARVADRNDVGKLRKIAGRLLQEGAEEVVLRRRDG